MNINNTIHTISCAQCNISFPRKYKDIKCALKNNWKPFCSPKCMSEHRTIKKLLPCHTCGKKVWRGLRKRNLTTLFFCSHSCRASHFGKTRWQVINGVGWEGHTSYRSKIEKVCIGCGEDRVYLLMVHHIDGNRKNSKIENLETVCPTCHTIRHLDISENNNWKINFKKLTPRDKLDEIMAESINGKSILFERKDIGSTPFSAAN